MTPERFQQIEALYHAARGRTAEERVALLADADPEVRREVESLLAQRAGGEFLDRPAIQNAPPVLGDSTLTILAVGASLGPYRIESKLGEGGMGEVYLAIDTRLGRAVAIKTTREQFSTRFEREARAISSLNHPNICTLYDVGPNYLVMELVEGETIAARLKSGPLPVKAALLYASQILAALAEAHEKGVIHRDLKPSNIMIAKSGIKVLDFGLAKSGQDETITASHIVMGTPAYMAPEQREGKQADTRSDIYSFGCVFYEMLTGARVAYQRRRIPSRKLEKIVSRCLEEDSVHRWQSAAELHRELAGISATGSRGNRYAAAVASFRTDDAYSHRTPKLADRSTVVLADFANATDDPGFDSSLRRILAVQLENSPGLSLLPDVRVSQALCLMGRPANAKLTPEVAAEICERTASAAVVEGSITSLGSKYVLSLRARNCRTGEVLDQEQATAAKKEDASKALGQMAKRFGTRCGESIPRAEKEPRLAVEATTPSLEAWKSYRAATKAFQSKAQTTEVISLLKRAIEVDPKFAIAYAYLGRGYADLGETELAAENVAKAYELRHGVSDRENYFITFTYHRQATRNLELCRQTLESWAHKYPGDFLAHSFLSGFTSTGSGHYERAVEEGQKAIELDPDFAIGYENVAFAYIHLNRVPEAEALLHKASERKIEVVQFSLLRYFIAFLRNDKAAMEREVTQRRVKLEAQGWFEHQEAMTLAYQGRLKEADRLSGRALSLARQGGLVGRAAMFQGAGAVWNALFGNRAEAQRSAALALSLFRSRDADYGPAFALALLRDSAQAHKIAADLEERYPQDTSVQFSYLPTLRALAALNQDDPAKALEMTQVSAPYDLAVPGTAYFTGTSFFGALYPVYVRGLAYSQMDRPDEAANVFQRILDHPGIVLNDPIGPMARLQRARALSASGDRAKSAAVYKDLLVLWRDADPDIPVLQQARAESAKL
ncbi:MAG TPA: serine/threonine-protein kinase [Candidatus Acidoferrales bacterium]|nr:serine/threonine-protein kinase [Candidatus Acidoferrales bacterium]